MSSKAPVSVIIIAKNEEKRIEDCLKSVSWAEEILVIDDESTDATAEIAERYQARVLKRAMDTEGKQRNFGVENASQPWILMLDADERVSPELAAEITTGLSAEQNGHVCYSIPVRTYIGNEWLKGAGHYPAPKSRLFRKGEYRYDEDAKVHPRVFYQGTAGRLTGDIYHYSCRDFEHWLAKFNRETTLEAEKWVKDGRKVTLPKILRKTVDRFLKNYLFKGGWKTGFMGYLMSVFHGLYHLITYAKYRELKR